LLFPVVSYGTSQAASSWNQRRTRFNNQGGIPGRNPRPLYIATDIPLLPPLSTPDGIQHCELVRNGPSPPSPQRAAPPPPPPHRPGFFEHAEELLATPPPSRSLRTDDCQIDRNRKHAGYLVAEMLKPEPKLL
jgi:hypothetical protein